jgi:hypothetical protein
LQSYAGFSSVHEWKAEQAKRMKVEWKGNLKMKTFIVYDLDSKMPVAVGEQVSAETARYCASMATGIFHGNLLAEEIDLKEAITH